MKRVVLFGVGLGSLILLGILVVSLALFIPTGLNRPADSTQTNSLPDEPGAQQVDSSQTNLPQAEPDLPQADSSQTNPQPAEPDLQQAGASQTGPATQVVATLNGEAITAGMVEAEVNISRLNVLEPSPPLTGEDLARAREEALNQLISRHLILQAAASQNFTLDNDFIQKRVDLLFGGYDAAALDEALRVAGATREDLFWWVSELTTAEEFTVQVIMAGADPDARHQVYNDWLNTQQAAADIQIFSDGAAESFAAVVGKPAPDFTLATLDGRSVSLSDYKGKVVLVNFWATWCPSCVGEMPEYEQVYQGYYQPSGNGQPAGDFVILGVNLQEDPAWVQEFTSGLGITFPILLDKDGSVTGRQYKVAGMPSSFIIDRQGVIFYRHLGPMSGKTLTAKLAELGLQE